MSGQQIGRRVVTGLDAAGQSAIVIDGPVTLTNEVGGMIWRTPAIPADNSGTRDAAGPFDFDLIHQGGSHFLLVQVPPDAEPYMHATDTLDYMVVVKGEVVLVVETGETVLRAGDFLVDRGIVHALRNDTGETALLAIVTLPSIPVGKGRTV